MEQSAVEFLVTYLKHHHLQLTTFESATKGALIHQLSEVHGSSDVINCGYVSHCLDAERQILHIDSSVMLSAEQLTAELAVCAMRMSSADISIATTRSPSNEEADEEMPQEFHFGWCFKVGSGVRIFLEKKAYVGDSADIYTRAAMHAAGQLPAYRSQLLRLQNSERPAFQQHTDDWPLVAAHQKLFSTRGQA